MRTIKTTYAYHPGDRKADLKLPTEVVAKYRSVPDPRARLDPGLEADIEANGVLEPLTIKTNGQLAVLVDGHSRVRAAQRLGIKKLPVQVLPDNFRRMRHNGGFPPLDSALASWVESNLWAHEGHDVVRHVIGGGPGSIKANKYAKCVCSCGAHWKEEA